MPNDYYNILLNRFGDDTILSHVDTTDPSVLIDSEHVQTICMFLRYNPELKFSFLSSISAVDFPEEERIEIVYHLYSLKDNTLCVLKTSVNRTTPELESIESVWKTAGWFEREIFDLMGVRFLGHTNLKRILLPEDWKGYPLRKDYMEEPLYHEMETTRVNLPKSRR